MDVPIPEVYVQVTLSEDGTEEFGVVDGQQRLRTILQFIGIETVEDQADQEEDNNSFALEKLPATSNYKDNTFSDVKGEKRKSFFQYEMCVRLLYTDNSKEVEDVFKRLNKYTLPLKAQELRNATYHGPFARLSEELANDDYWAVNRIISPAAIRRMADIEMMSDLLIGIMHGPQGGAAKVIDEYYEQYEPLDEELPGQTKLKHQFQQTLELIGTLFPDISSAARWANRADFYTLFVAIGAAIKSGASFSKSATKALAKSLEEFAEEVDSALQTPTAKAATHVKTYARAIEKGTNDRTRRKSRHEVVLKLIMDQAA